MVLMRRCSIALLVLPLALTACGGSSKKVDPVADLAVAKGAVLTRADLPGYTGTPHSKSDDIPASVKKDFAACAKAPTTLFDDTPGAQKADSDDFAKGDASVSVSITLDPKKSDINDKWDQFSKPGVEPCLVKLFEAAIKQGSGDTPGVSYGPTTVDRFEPRIGDRSVGYAVAVPAKGPGASAVFYLDLVLVPRDRAGMTFSFSNVSAPFDRSTEISLMQKVYDRIGDNAS